jgi:transaldolase
MSLASLIATGTKVWLDGVSPENVRAGSALGVTGSTSNPTIVARIVQDGAFDDHVMPGVFQSDPNVRNEFLARLGRK